MSADAAHTNLMSRAFEEQLRTIISSEHLRTAKPADAVAGVLPRVVVEPGNEEELARVLKIANDAGLAIVPRGGGTKLGWGNPPARADLILSTARMNRIVEHAWADLTVTVEAGCPVQKLQDTLSEHGQRLALDPLWPERATIGGVLSTNDSGSLRLRFGALRDLIIGVTLALPDGTLAKSGGKVVKNVAGYDLPKLATGALGTLGVITQAVFRLHPAAKKARTISFTTADFEDAQRLIFKIQDSQLAHVALQARFALNGACEVDVLFEGTEAGIAAQVTQTARLAAPLVAAPAANDEWKAREELWIDSATGAEETVIVKLSVAPADLSKTMSRVARESELRQLRWRAVLQATGIGWLRLDGPPGALSTLVRSLRGELERSGGSLTLLLNPQTMSATSAWSEAGDALPLMRALKRNFDPKNTLNQGRFVGGI